MEDWRRLGSYAKAARIAAGYRSRAAFAEVCGLAERTLDNLEGGRRMSDFTLAQVEPHLGWAPGAARRVLGGGEPTVTADPLEALIAALPADWQGPARAFFAAIDKHTRDGEGNGSSPRAGGAAG